MKEKNNNTQELMLKLKDNQLNKNELEKVSGGDVLYLPVDPGRCPKHRSKYVIYSDERSLMEDCVNCERAKGLFGNSGRCEYSFSGNYRRE